MKAPHKEIKVNLFRRSDDIYLDIDADQYRISLKDILELEDLDKRSTSVAD